MNTAIQRPADLLATGIAELDHGLQRFRTGILQEVGEELGTVRLDSTSTALMRAFLENVKAVVADVQGAAQGSYGQVSPEGLLGQAAAAPVGKLVQQNLDVLEEAAAAVASAANRSVKGLLLLPAQAPLDSMLVRATKRFQQPGGAITGIVADMQAVLSGLRNELIASSLQFMKEAAQSSA